MFRYAQTVVLAFLLLQAGTPADAEADLLGTALRMASRTVGTATEFAKTAAMAPIRGVSALLRPLSGSYRAQKDAALSGSRSALERVAVSLRDSLGTPIPVGSSLHTPVLEAYSELIGPPLRSCVLQMLREYPYHPTDPITLRATFTEALSSSKLACAVDQVGTLTLAIPLAGVMYSATVDALHLLNHAFDAAIDHATQPENDLPVDGVATAGVAQDDQLVMVTTAWTDRHMAA